MKRHDIRKLLTAFEVLADLGPEITAERDFPQTAASVLGLVMQALDAREAALFTYGDKPAMLTSAAAQGFASFPTPAFIPLLPRHVHALLGARAPQTLNAGQWESFLTPNGNVSPQMFRCLAPLRVGGRFVGAIALGRREGDSIYGPDDIEVLNLLSSYVALAVGNHTLAQSLQARISENLKLMASLHSACDRTVEAFATAIDVKDVHTRGHSLRVGRYAAGIAEAVGMDPNECNGLRCAGYLHDIGKVTVDKYLFSKPSALEPSEFRQMADHTVIGHQIVNGVQFPWGHVQEVVRSHHERADGTGYPDHLHHDEVATEVRIIAVSDTFDAMTSSRPYRKPLSVGEALSEIVSLTPTKFDGEVVQGLLIQLRRDAAAQCSYPRKLDVASDKPRFLDESIECHISPTDIDHLSSTLMHRLGKGRVYSA